MLLSGLDGCVILTPRECAVFGPLLRRALDDLVRRDGVRVPSEVFKVVEELEAAGRASRQRRTGFVDGLSVTKVAPLSSGNVGTVKEVSVSEAARTVGRTRQAVLARIRSGSLPARRNDRGQWLIAAESLAPAV